MNYKERFQAVKDFLIPWMDVLEVEVAKRYPQPLPNPIAQWVEALQGADANELLVLENEHSTVRKHAEFENFLEQIQKLSSFSGLDFTGEALPKHLQRRVDLKKRHELERMRFLMQGLGSFETVLDIGGGAGHLSATLVDGHERRAYCLDRSDEFQKQGRERLSKWDPVNFEKVEFIQCDFPTEINDELSRITRNNLVVGLHGCGDLSTNTIRHFLNAQAGALISVGCCYQDLKGAYNLCSLARQDGLNFSKNALHLAARSHAYMSFQDMERKIMVRRFRYGLHYYLCSQGRTEFQAIGKTGLGDYAGKFSAFAQKYLPYTVCSEELDRFFESPQTQTLIEQTIIADILRGLLGRVVETYIVLDRAIFLEEAGLKPQVVEAFNRMLSPRNLAIIAKR